MRIGTMLGEVVRSLLHRPVTERYPAETRPTPDRLRGPLEWEREKCTGCNLCVMDCPARAIEIVALDKKAKRFVFTYHLDRCTYCAQCTYSCNQGALRMRSEGWELATGDRARLTEHWGLAEDVTSTQAKEAIGDGSG
jgi:formate hydrogenlyase subunit 6/NADH:ubiquinone oxidoreductase subunit I